MKNYALKFNLTAFIVAGLFANAANALDVKSPYVEKGIMEFEQKNRFDVDSRASIDRFRQHKFEIGYGITNNWAVELGGEWEKDGGKGYKHSASEIENIFQFTETGEYWLDVGAKLAYEAAHPKGSADKVESYLLLAKNWSKFSSLVNVGFDKEIGSNSNQNPVGVLKFMTKYNYTKILNPAIEYYGNFGEITHTQNFDNQRHSIGPALYGSLGKGVKYEFGTIFGVSKTAPDAMIKFNLEYEFPY